MKDYAKSFYNSSKWRKLSKLYMTEQHYVCERCGDVATICHHKRYITPDNVTDPSITLNTSNLECLCQNCHNQEHSKAMHTNGMAFDEAGNLIKAPEVYIVCGAPGSGKTTYVRERKSANDIVFDLDYICAALMGTDDIYQNHDSVLQVALELKECFLSCIEQRRGKWAQAWIITSTPDRFQQAALAQRLRGEIVTMPATLNECIERIQRDERRQNKIIFVNIAKKWFEAMEGGKE